MLVVAKAHLRERAQAVLARYDYQVVPFFRAAKISANEGMLELIRSTRDGPKADKEFADFAIEFGCDSFSQWQQECFALWANEKKRDGVFVEFGAADGVTHSNTFILESSYGWKGVLLEPLPWAFNELQRRRPRAACLNVAVDPGYSEKPKPMTLITAGQYSSLTGYQDSDKHSSIRSKGRAVRAKCINLNDELRKIIPSRVIDFLSIDVEGPELDIIKGFDFDSISVKALTIEVNDRDDDAETISKILESKGYRQPFTRAVTRGDLWFVKSHSL
jgi:FkbM family methyltransferase